MVSEPGARRGRTRLSTRNGTGHLLEISGLKTHFFTADGVARAVDGVDLTLDEGETLSIVGEPGGGQTVPALSLLRLVPDPPGKIVAGEIRFRGKDLLSLSEKEIREVRGNDISMIFQEPMTSLNPVFTVGYQIVEAVTLHQGLSRREAWEKAVEMLDKVGIPDPARRTREYPHQLSGGMRQRAMIAMALSCNPQILIADEPTTALDVTIQAQILELMKRLQEDFGTAIILITHNLGVVAETSRRVAVMYAGVIIEEGSAEQIFSDPRHPYTQGLLGSIPRIDAQPGSRLVEIPGVVPSLYEVPAGCKFAPRCPYAAERCEEKEPPLFPVSEGRTARCLLEDPVNPLPKKRRA
ncbi:MAG: ABC transporter ATP-binding protein [Candidatus Tectomicrobia bacterium]|nr:ABC transporter ATP-binding protein [Candidatus Tectomicrobia bacterium]